MHLIPIIFHHAIIVFLFQVILFVIQKSNEQSCGPRVSPRLLAEIPCDMTKTQFCTSPGTAYPWNSVRRYIYENQGFMKRMYGDQRHSIVLKNEIDELREKYDSIYFFGRSRDSHKVPSFGPRSLDQGEYPFVNNNTINTSSTTSTTLNVTETTKTVQNETITSIERENVSEEHSIDNEATSTESVVTNHEVSDLPSPDPYIDLILPQTTTTTTTTSPDEREEEPKKGVNACPVKEEVIAPYWANNTRGEVLALLNVYPFEQYIHWEKCAYENSQMFCRDGCRCEQQYRLHRLLAFDPKNECRGVFADWFRFPSCCVCICYDLPENSYYRYNRRRAKL